MYKHRGPTVTSWKQLMPEHLRTPRIAHNGVCIYCFSTVGLIERRRYGTPSNTMQTGGVGEKFFQCRDAILCSQRRQAVIAGRETAKSSA